MIPQPNQHITIYFKNSQLQLEGKVVSWSNTISVIESIAGASTIVIQKTADDVLAYKISTAQPKYEQLKEKTIKTEDDIKDIAKLKIELNELEKQEIADKLSTHTADNIRQVQYGIPKSITTIPSAKQYPTEKIQREDIGINRELSSLFQKRH